MKVLITFRFQIGAIKSDNIRIGKGKGKEVSIPNWCD